MCKAWNELLSEAPLLERIFRHTWGLSSLIGEPTKPSLYLVCEWAALD